MIKHPSTLTIRLSNDMDRPFIYSLSPILAAPAQLAWHDEDVIQKFQKAYIEEMLAETKEAHATFIAEADGAAVGFMHIRLRVDEISEETSATVPLLAVTEQAQGLGVGRALMQQAEAWAQQQNCRLLHLEVFSNNSAARGFYDRLGFQEETIHMIKPLLSPANR